MDMTKHETIGLFQIGIAGDILKISYYNTSKFLLNRIGSVTIDLDANRYLVLLITNTILIVETTKYKTILYLKQYYYKYTKHQMLRLTLSFDNISRQLKPSLKLKQAKIITPVNMELLV